MATFTWNGSANGSWANGANWVGGVAPSGATHTLVFSTASLTGSAVVSTANDIAGLTDITVQITDTSTTANFTLAGPNAIGLSAAGLTDSTVTGRTTTVSMDMSGTGGVASTGAGRLTLSGNNSYDGAVNISGGGLLQAASVNALGSTVGGTFISNATTTGGTGTQLELNGTISFPAGEALTMTSNAAPDNRVALVGAGGTPVWQGPITMAGTGSDQVYNTVNITGDISGPAFTGNAVFRGTGTATVTGSLNIPTGNFAKTDASTLIIGAVGKTYAWGTSQISVGIVRMTAPNVMPSNTVVTMGQNDTNTASLDLNGNSQTITGLTSNPTTQGANTTGKTVTSATAATLTVNDAAARTYASLLTGAGLSVIKSGAGAWTLLGANTQGGTFTISGGSVLVGNGGTQGTIGNGLVTNNGTLTFNRTDTVTLPPANNVTGTGTVNWSGTGVFNLTGTLSATNPLNVTAGTLTGTGTSAGTTTISSGVTVDPGSVGGVGELDTGAFSLAAGSTFAAQLGATADLLNSTGAVALGTSNLVVTLVGYTGTTGSVYTIAQGTSLSGTFLNLAASGGKVYAGGRVFTINYTATSVTLTDAGAAVVPSTVYVDDSWAAMNFGDAIADADPQTAGNQPATFGLDAYYTINSALAAAPAGSLVFVNNGTYAEAVSLGSNDTLRLLGTAVATPGTVTINALTTATGTTVDTGTLANVLAINNNNANTTVAGLISGSGSLNKVGTGTVILTANNTYAGTTTVTAGTLQVGNGGTTGTVGTGNVIGPGTSTIQYTRSDNINIPNLFTGTVTLTQTGAGNINFTGGNNNAFRALNLNSITTIDFGSGATSFNNAGAATLSSTNSGTINATGGTITFPSAADNSSSAGELVINARLVLGASTFEACCNDGFITLTNANNTMAAVQINNGSKLSVASFANPGPLGAATSITFNNDAANVLRYTGAGETTTRTIANNATTANVTLDNSGTGPLVYTTITVPGSGAKSFVLTGSTSGTAEITGNIPNSGGGATGIIKTGTGTWILSGPNAFNGATAVNAGTLLVNGAPTGASATTVASGAVLGGSATAYPGAITPAAGGILDPGAIGAAGKFSSTGAVNLNTAGAVFRVQLGANTTAGTTYDQLSSTGTVNVTGGTLSLGQFAPFTAGGTYDIITAATVTGTFAGLPNNAFVYINGEKFQIQYTATKVSLVHQNLAPISTSTIYVNNAWDAGATTGTDADGAGVLTAAILNANTATTIQGGIDLLPAGGGTVVILGNPSGTPYAAAYNVNKNVSFQFAADTVPASLADTAVFISGIGTLTNSATSSAVAGPLTAATGATFSGAINSAVSGGAGLDLSGVPVATPITTSAAIGATTAPSTFTSNNATTVSANITTTGAQTYSGTTTIGAAVNLTAPTFSAAALTLNANLTTTISGTGTITGAMGGAAFGLTKAGAGTLTVSGSGSYTGATVIAGGVLKLGANNALPTGAPLTVGSAGGLGTFDMDTFSQTVTNFNGAATNNAGNNIVTIAAGQTLTATGTVTIGTSVTTTDTQSKLVMNGGGAFVASGAATTFQVGGDATNTAQGNSATLDMSALGSFTASVTTFKIGDNQTGTGNSTNTVILAPTSSITATTLALDTGRANVQTLRLGSGVNTINADTINVGQVGNRASGLINFNSAAGSVIVRNKAGTGRAAFNVGGGATGTDANITADVLLAGHNADLQITTLRIAERQASGATQTGGTIASFTFDTGTLDATGIIVATKSGTTATNSVVNGTLTIGGGTVNIGASGLTSATTSYSTGTGSLTATVTISGGAVVNAAGDIKKVPGAGTQTANSTISIDNATIRAGVSSTTFFQAMTTATIQAGGAIFDTNNFNVTAAQAISGSGAIAKNGLGTLTLSGNSAFGGGIAVNNGTLTIATGGNLPNATGITVGSTGNTASLTVTSTGTASLGTGNVVLGFGGGTGSYVQNGAAGTANIGGGITDVGTTSVAITNGTTNVANGFATDNLAVAVTTTATNATGTLNVNGGAVTIGSAGVDLEIGRSTLANNSGTVNGTLNLAGASSANITAAAVRIGVQVAATGTAATAVGTLNLPTANASVNSLVANSVLVGDSPGFGNGTNSIFNLGAGSSTIDASSVIFGGAKSNSTVQFSGPGGTFTLRGTAGGASTSNLSAANNSPAGTGTITTGVVNLAGGTFNGQIGTLLLGFHTGGGTGSGAGSLTMDAGNTTVATLQLGNGDTAATTGTVTLNGGTLSVTGTLANVGSAAIGTVNHNGGTLRFGTLSKATGALNYNFNAGTIQNNTGAALTTTNATVNLLTGGTHTFDVTSGQTATFQATSTITGVGSLTKTGLGTLTLSGTNSYTGTTNINGGTLSLTSTLVDGTSNPDVIVNNGGTLGGSGTINSAAVVSVQPGGAIAPGTSPGILTTGNVGFSAGAPASGFNIEINGTTVGTGYDQLNVVGTVDLGTSTNLNVTGTLTPTPGTQQTFIIINNDGADAVTGTFAGLPETSFVTLNGQKLYVSYVGGDGNDVVLSSQPIVSGTSGNDSIVIRRQTAGATDGDIEYSLNGGAFVPVSGAGAFNFNGQAGNDTMTVDFVNGDTVPASGINLNGNAPTTGPGDLVVVDGRGLGNNAAYTPNATTTGNGVIVMGGVSNGTITFTGLEPVDITGMAAASFVSPATTTVATIANGNDFATNLIPAIRVTGTSNAIAFESVAFWNNTTVTIDTATNGGTGVDTLTVTNADNAHNNRNLTINTGGGTDRLNLNGGINTDGNLIFTAVEGVVVGANVTIDSEQGNNNNAGDVNFGTAVTSASAAGNDLTINTNVTAGVFNGGAVTLGVFNNAAPGAAFVNDLAINTSGNGGGTAGLTTLSGSILLDETAADPASFTLTGNGKVAIAATASTTLTIDTDDANNANNGSPNSILFNSANIYAVNTGVTLTLATLSGATASANVGVTSQGLVDNNAGANNFLRSLTFQLGNAASNSSAANFNGNVFTDGGQIGGTLISPNFTTSVTLDTAQGATATGGNITFSNSGGAPAGANADLVFDTSAVTTGGTVAYTNLNNNAGVPAAANAINDITINTNGGTTDGNITISGNTFLDNNGADTGDFTVLGGGQVRFGGGAVRIIDTETGDNGVGGSINFGASPVSATATNADLSLNTSTALAGANGGAVTLAVLGNGGSQFINDLTITKSAGAGGTPGLLTLGGNITLDNNADVADFTVTGGGGIAISLAAPGTLTIDTENGNTAAAGGVNFGATSTLYAANPGTALVINTDGGANTGGAVTLGLVNDNGGANNFLTGLNINTQGSTSGEILMNANISTDGAITFNRRITANASVVIDSKQSATGPGNPITLSGVIYAIGAGRDVTLDTSTPAAGQNGGAVILPELGVDPIGTAGRVFLNDFAINTSGGAGGTGGSLTLRSGVFNLEENGAADPGGFTLTGNGNLILGVEITTGTTVTINPEQGNTAGIPASNVNLNLSNVSAVNSGVDFVIDTTNTGAGSVGGAITFGGANNAAGNFVNDLTLTATGPTAGDAFGDVVIGAAVTLATDAADTGALTITAGDVTQTATAPIVTTGPVSVTARQSVALNTSLNAGADTVTILANQDGAGAQGLTMATGASITTTNESATAIDVTINTATGTGGAALSALSAGLVTGTINVDANGGAITDANGAAVNLTAAAAVLEGAAGIDLDTAIGELTASSTNTAITLRETNGVAVNTVNAGTGVVTLTLTAGAVTDNNAAALNVTAGLFDVIAPGGIDLDTAIAQLTAASTNSPIIIRETNGVAVNTVNAGTGDVTLTLAAGAVTDNNAAALNVTAGHLNVTGPGGVDLDTALSQLTAASTNAAIVIRETNGLAVNTVNAGTGNVTLTLAAGAITDNNGVGTLNVTAGLLTATAPGGINLDTDLTSLTGTTTNTDIVIREASAVAVNTLSAGTGMVSLSAGGAVTDNNGAANNVTAASLLIVASGGISLDTTVGQLAASNSTSGDILIINTGALNITTLSEPSIGSVSGVLNPAGAVTVTALSPLTVSSPVSALGAVLLTAGDSAAAGDDLNVNATVTSTGSSVTLNSGDNATINATLTAATTVAINIDAADADPATGATLNIPTGVVISATSATFTGGTQADAFNFAPQVTTPINVFGLAPVANPGGDTMLLDTAAPVTNPTLNILGGQGAGLYTFGNRANVQYSSIENANTTTPIHIALDSTATGIDNIRLQRSTPAIGVDFEVYNSNTNDLLYAGPIVNVLSFLFLGSANPNTVTIDDVNGLVDLAGTVPAPTGVGNNGNVTGTPEIFLRGNGGTDGVVYANTANATDQIYGFGTGAGPGSQAGEVYTTNGPRALSVYFDGMESVTSNDATPADTGTLTIVGDANANTISLASSAGGTTVAAVGYVPFTFAPQAFNAAIVNAGDNNDSITLVSLNAAESGLALALNGELGNDTISVESAPAGSTLALQGGVGNDAYQLGGAANTVDNILIPITIADTSGVDSLTLNDSADLSGDTVTITDSIIDGVNGAPSPNVSFSAIEALDVTTSGGGDAITTTLNGTTGLVTVNVHGAGGDDDFFLNTADGMTTLTTINLIGEAGNDDFGSAMAPIHPLAGTTTNLFLYGDTTAITTNPGGAVTDHLFLDMTTTSAGMPTQPLVIVDTVTGQATTANTRLLRFGGMEDIDLYDGGVLTDVAIGDLYLRATNGVDNLIFYRENGGVFVKRNGVPVSATPYAPTNRVVAYGRAGNDYMEFNFTMGSTLSADFRGEDDNDTLVGGLGSDLLVGGGGHDNLKGGEGADTLYGEDQFLTSSPIAFNVQRATGLVLSAAGGNDTLDGGGGNDFVFGGTGDDNLNGGAGNDYVHGGDGSDTLNSGGGNDILRGEAGVDTLNGDTGNDILLGGAGDDRLFGRGNRDFMLAGAGADQIQDTEGSEDITVAGGLSFDADNSFAQPGASLTGLNDNDLALQALMFTGPNAWSGGALFAARVANVAPLTAIIDDGVVDIILGNTAGQDYIISNTNDSRLNTTGDLLVTM